MGNHFVVIVENKAARTQESINEQFFGGREGSAEWPPPWELFDYDNKSYAIWNESPRVFIIDNEPEKWEALRKYIARVRDYFGGGEVFFANQAVWFGEKYNGVAAEGFYLPPRLSDEELTEPDYEKHPELADIKQLKGMTF